MTDATTSMKSRDILFIFDARDCNPNGERQSGREGPRIDPHTGKALVSDVSFKRTIRDYFMTKNSKNDRVLIQQKFTYSKEKKLSMKQKLLKDLTDDQPDLIDDMDKQALYSLIQEKFIDHRLFGSIFFLNRQLTTTTGAVQFEHSLSYNQPNLLRLVITSTMASETGKGAGAMGKYVVLDYAIFLVHGLAKQTLSEISGATEEDAHKLFDAMWNGIKTRLTRTKFQQQPRLLLSVVMKDARFQLSNMKNTLKMSKTNPKKFENCILDITDFIKKIKEYKEEIEKVEYREDPFIHYRFGEKTVNSIVEITNLEENLPRFQEIEDFH